MPILHKLNTTAEGFVRGMEEFKSTDRRYACQVKAEEDLLEQNMFILHGF